MARYDDAVRWIAERDTAVARAEAAEAEAKRLREALRPFADLLSRYDLSRHTLITLWNDSTGQRLNVSHRGIWEAARAAIRTEGEG